MALRQASRQNIEISASDVVGGDAEKCLSIRFDRELDRRALFTGGAIDGSEFDAGKNVGRAFFINVAALDPGFDLERNGLALAGAIGGGIVEMKDGDRTHACRRARQLLTGGADSPAEARLA